MNAASTPNSTHQSTALMRSRGARSPPDAREPAAQHDDRDQLEGDHGVDRAPRAEHGRRFVRPVARFERRWPGHYGRPEPGDALPLPAGATAGPRLTRLANK